MRNDDQDGFLREARNRIEVVRSMHAYVADQLHFLPSPENTWQPSDLLPNPASEDFYEQVLALQASVLQLPDDVLIVLIGNTITEEALPSYQAFLNRLDGVTDELGDSPHPWARWSRGWTAEENRHGDVINRFLYLSGRVDMRVLETTIQHLLRNGFNPQDQRDPYRGFIYTSFQERATKIAHLQMAALAEKSGCPELACMCRLIAGDEARHEEVYKRFMDHIFGKDPGGAVLALAALLEKTIRMPGVLMDGQDQCGFYGCYSELAERLGVYTIRNYAEIIDHLVKRWKIPTLNGLTGEASRAQDYVSGLSDRYIKLAARRVRRTAANRKFNLNWIRAKVPHKASGARI